MKRILYLNNFMTLDFTDLRKNRNTFSQPGNNKMIGILDALRCNQYDVTVLSNGFVNNKTGKWFKRHESVFHDTKVIYCSIWDLPLLNTVSSIFSMYHEIKVLSKQSKIDHILFYNYKPEVAFTALLAKSFLHIPITVEFEDGLPSISYLGKFKKKIFALTEKIVSKKVDSAIVINSIIAKQYEVPVEIIRGVVNVDFRQFCQNYSKKRNEKFTLLYSGGLNEARGIYVLLEALKFVSCDFELIITGKGELDLIDDPRVQFKGFVSIEDAHDLMCQADVLIIPQLKNNKFGDNSFPSKLFEYIATGNMIIASNVSDIQDFAGDSIDYYDNDDPMELAKKIDELYLLWSSGIEKRDKIELLCKNNLPEGIGEKIKNIFEKTE